ncbi:MAG: YesL family protein [Dorea sp.]|jgi:uncharacterized membrane protein YesL|nr:YesL family protein [Dorea sp.]
MRSEKILNGLSKIGDMLILNFIYVLSCIPIITIGASTTALYYTTLKMAENNESYVWRDYWKAFKSNLKQATVIWLIVFAGWAVIALDFLIAGGLSMQLGTVVAIGVVIVAVFMGILGLYVFPLLARFDNTVVKTMKNAVMIAIRHLPSTILIALIHAAPLLVAFVSIEAFLKGFIVIMLFAASPLAYLESKLFVKVFYRYYPKTECVEAAS